MGRFISAGLKRQLSFLVFTSLINFNVLAEDQESIGAGKFSFEVGALILLGTDIQLYYRREGNPLILGYRYLETEDDFVDEAAFGFPSDNSDKEFITRTGPFFRYLVSPNQRESYYFSAALFKTTEKVECGAFTDEDSATSPYIGGGYMGWLDQSVSYNIGFLFAPGEKLEVNAGGCESESSGNFDLSLGLALNF
ncbi:MAG: hypothetical protein AAF353_20430 [Pseudomonadota bacterium]